MTTEPLPASPPAPGRAANLATLTVLLRHQLGAGAASFVDFATMIGAVRLLGVPPTWATAAGASLGAVANFLLSRRWVFTAEQGAAYGQALRYALVSGGSLLLNVALVWLLHDEAHLHYVVARLVGSLLVSLLWNFPMHRHFVFGASS